MPEPDPTRFDTADANRAYDNYLENCRRLGVEPMSWDRVQAQMAEWLKALALGHATPSSDETALRFGDQENDPATPNG